jgi:hypothetical protein
MKPKQNNNILITKKTKGQQVDGSGKRQCSSSKIISLCLQQDAPWWCQEPWVQNLLDVD